MRLKTIFIVITLFNFSNCISQNFQKKRELKQKLIEQHLPDASQESGKIPSDTYENIVAGCGGLSYLTIYKTHYKFEYINMGYGYYDIGTYTFKNNVVELKSLIKIHSDNKKTGHDNIMNLTGVKFIFKTLSENTYCLESNTKDIFVSGRKDWVLKKTTSPLLLDKHIQGSDH